MKTIIISLFSLLIFVGQIQAQKIESYELQLPKTILKSVHSVAVVGYETQERQFGISQAAAKQIAKVLNNKTNGLNDKTEKYNSWLSTQLNVMNFVETGTSTESVAIEAGASSDAVLVIGLDVEEVYTAVPSEINSISLEKIPYKQKKFELKRVMKISGAAKAIKNDDKSVMQSWNINFEKNSEAIAYDYADSPKLKSTKDLANESAAYLSSLFIDLMQAKLIEYKYDFQNIRKIKDSEQKDLDKELTKLLRKSSKSDVNIIYSKMKQFAEKGFEEPENNAKANYNLGLMNELVGNYEKAKEYYEKAKQLYPTEKDYQKAIDHVKELQDIKDLLKAQGFEIQDYSF